jgi:hypothetical protein
VIDVEPDASFGAVPIDTNELKDLNRMRSYLRDVSGYGFYCVTSFELSGYDNVHQVATRNGVTFTRSIEEAVAAVIESHTSWQRYEEEKREFHSGFSNV